MARAPLLALLALAGCPPPPVTSPIPPVSTGKVRVRVFTEPSPVRVITSVGDFVFASTEHELERWDAKGGVLNLSAEHGLSGHEIVAVASDPQRRWIWVLTEGGLGHYDASAEVFREQTTPPASLAMDFAQLAKQGASLAASIEGGVWLGTQQGLYFVSEQGGWASTPIKEPIRALARSATGWLFMATTTGLVARKPTGETIRIGPAQGCAIANPRIFVELPEDRLLVVGTDLDGHERLAIGKDGDWTTYRALPDVAWDAAAPRGTGAVLMGGGRVYHLGLAVPGRVRPLARDGMRLLAVAVAGPQLDWVIDPLDVQPPPGAVSLGSAQDQILIGTRDLGTARYRDGDSRPSDWLRRRQMVEDATALTVACASQSDCWIATGGDTAWRWNGEGFTAGGPADQVVVSVVRNADGQLFGLHRGAEEPVLHVSAITGSTWTPIEKLTITSPGEAPDVAFARFGAGGQLWLGLRYRDGIEMRAGGVAVVDLEAATVAYHRTGAEVEPGQPPPLPIPMSVVDAEVRGDTVWFATSEGVARLVNKQLTLWTEADGLRSEFARAVTIATDGSVIIATGQGAARWTGKAWDFPAALRFDINDVVATRNGQVWMATDRGIAAWDGKKVRRVDTRRGLAENTILEVATDQYDRVWARGAGSLTLISQ